MTWYIASRYYMACCVLNVIWLIMNLGFGITTFMGIKTGYLGLVLLIAGVPIILAEILYYRKKERKWREQFDIERNRFERRGDFV